MEQEIEEVESHDEPESAPKSDKPETVEETVKRAYAQLKGETDESSDPASDPGDKDADEDPEKEEEQSTKSDDDKPKRNKKRTVEFDKLDPPATWSAPAKEWFKRQSKEIQQEHKRMADQWTAHTKKLYAEIKSEKEQLQKEREEFSHLKQGIYPYAEKWAARGVTVPQGIAQLAAFNDLVEKDVEKAIYALAKTRGLEIEIKNGKSKQNGVAPQPQLDYQSIYSQIRQDLSREQQAAQVGYQQKQLASEIDSSLEELRSVENEAGFYCYPDFHEESFLRRLKPLVTGIHQDDPSVPWKEVLLRAYRAANGRIIPRKQAQKPQNQTLYAARKASSSKPGSINGSMDDYRAKPGESVEETVRKAMAYLTQR